MVGENCRMQLKRRTIPWKVRSVSDTFDTSSVNLKGRGIMNPNRGVCLKKFKDFPRLVRTQIVGNYVDLATWRLAIHYLGQKIDKLRTVVAGTGLASTSPV